MTPTLSPDLALITLINKIKQLGFKYGGRSAYSLNCFEATSRTSGYGSKGEFVVYYRPSGHFNEPEYQQSRTENLCRLAVALMDIGLGVEPEADDGGLRRLVVFAYDTNEALAAYKAAHEAAAKEAAKVSPERKLERIVTAKEELFAQRQSFSNGLGFMLLAIAELQARYEALEAAWLHRPEGTDPDVVLADVKKAARAFREQAWSLANEESRQLSLYSLESAYRSVNWAEVLEVRAD